MTLFNPFPDYPVIRLQDDPAKVSRVTVPTAATDQVQALIGLYVERRVDGAGGPRSDPLVVGIRGDYGTGKTHLLLVAADRFQRGFRETRLEASLLRVACLEAD